MGVGAVIEYAVRHLHVKHIVILGHTDCGGLKALDQPPDWSREPHLARWIEHARPAKTKVEASGLPEEARHLATVRENVLLQLDHLRSYDPVREGERAGTLALHGWVYHLETGAFEGYDSATDTWQPLALAET
jgi:carbonic anhydrase